MHIHIAMHACRYPNGFQATCSVDEHLRGALLPGADLEHWQWEWPKDGRSAS